MITTHAVWNGDERLVLVFKVGWNNLINSCNVNHYLCQN